MLKFNELEKMVEYCRTTSLGHVGNTRVRIDENREFQFYMEKGEKWVYSSTSYNELKDSTFEPCEWVPKITEPYFSPDYIAHHGFLAYESTWTNTQRDKQAKQNVGVYRTAQEAHAKSLEMGWTL